MMEIKLTDKQFEQLQIELIKEVIHRTDNSKKKFIDVTVVDCLGMRDKPETPRQISICIDHISALISVDDAPNFKTDIIISNGSDINRIQCLCTSTVEEIKQMIKEAEGR